MNVKDEYLRFKADNKLKTGRFEDRVLLQKFLRDRLEVIWGENPCFSNGGLLRNYMTQFAIGFAYYDCRPSEFCRTHCYGLALAGAFDYNMFRLGVLTSESLKTGDPRFLTPLSESLKKLECVKIGHWGDAVLEQVPVVTSLVAETPNTTFWWYTRKQEIALAVNECNQPNLRAYLSLDPTTEYPAYSEYPYGITYFFGDGLRHARHQNILDDDRLIALFARKRGRSIEDPEDYGVKSHPKLCEEKRLALSGAKTNEMCLSCVGRCRFRTPQTGTKQGKSDIPPHACDAESKAKTCGE